jgi:hypothetical protein
MELQNIETNGRKQCKLNKCTNALQYIGHLALSAKFENEYI